MSFTLWLADQRGRRDAVGRFAWEWADFGEDRELVTLSGWIDALAHADAAPEDGEALKAAWVEWRGSRMIPASAAMAAWRQRVGAPDRSGLVQGWIRAKREKRRQRRRRARVRAERRAKEASSG
jgi:hypothetical protein